MLPLNLENMATPLLEVKTHGLICPVGMFHRSSKLCSPIRSVFLTMIGSGWWRLIVLAVFITLPAAAQVSVAGLEDQFAGPGDPASPSDHLRRVLDLRGGVQNFDMTAGLNGGTANTFVAHTFSTLPTGIVSATLEVSVRASSANGIETDGIFLSFVDSATTDFSEAVVWGRSFGPYLNPPASSSFTESDPTGLLGGWAAGQQATILIDLAAVPLASGGTLNFIPWLNSYQFLDVTVGDETAVDYMKLSVTTVENVPEPSSPMLLGIAATLYFLTLRRRKKHHGASNLPVKC
ncbi:MAG: PEP-CTERM sorting domain-containing protein [Luteolibacter sp.]